MRARRRGLKQLVTFLVLGAGNTVLTTSLYQMFLLNDVPYRSSFATAYLIGTALAVTVQPLIVFGGRVRVASLLIQTLAYGAVGVLGLMLLGLLVKGAGLPEWLSGYLVAGIGVLVNYCVARSLFSSTGVRS